MAQKKTAEEKAYEEREKRWRAESDAYTLAEAAVIQADKERLNSAQKIAQEKARQLEKEAANLKKLAKKK